VFACNVYTVVLVRRARRSAAAAIAMHGI
jgi:hypothetical protein